jgi:hypothetical protein
MAMSMALAVTITEPLRTVEKGGQAAFFASGADCRPKLCRLLSDSIDTPAALPLLLLAQLVIADALVKTALFSATTAMPQIRTP